MKSSGSCLCGATTSLSLLLITPLTGVAQEAKTPAPVVIRQAAADDIVVLTPFEVTTTKDFGYRAANSVSATRVDTAIKDLPFAISTFTPQIIVDTGSVSLYDIVRYSSGVTNGGSGFNRGSDSPTIRGFVQPAQHDGFYESSQGNIYVDMVNVERVEVVKGPASLLYGQVAPGGTVNYITKRPEWTPFLAVSFAGGSYGNARTTLDLNRPLVGKRIGFRVNASWGNAFQYQDNSEARTVVVAPSLTWNITSNLVLKLNYQSFERKETPPANQYIPTEVSTPASMVSAMRGFYPSAAAALVGKTGPGAAAGYNDASDPGFLLYWPGQPRRFNSSSKNDTRRTFLESENVELNLRLGEHWNGRANFCYNFNRSNQQQTPIGAQLNVAPPNSLVYGSGAWSVAPGWAALSAQQQTDASLVWAQQVTTNPAAAVAMQNGTPGPALNARRPREQVLWGNSKSVQAEVAGKYEFAWGKLNPLIGAFWNVSNNTNRIRQTNGNAVAPNFHYWDVNPASPTYYIDYDTAYDPATLPAPNQSILSFTSDQAAYALFNARFLKEHLFVVGGARYNQSQSQATNNLAAANAVGRGYRTHCTTPQIGGGYKITRDLMFYASYSQSYSLPSQAYLRTVQTVNGVVTSVPSTQAAPVTGEGYDVGFKTDFLNGRVSSTLSFYQITQTDFVQTVNQILAGQNIALDFQDTQVRGRGVEYELTWSPKDNLQVFASISEEDIRTVQAPAAYVYYLGAHPHTTAKTLGNLWARYTLKEPLKGLWIGAGCNYVGPTALDNRNKDNFAPAYTLWNASLGYDWKWEQTAMSANLNAQNLSDERYQPNQNVPGLPRRFVLAVTARFK